MSCVLALSFIGCTRSEKVPEAADGADRPSARSDPSSATSPATLTGSAWLVEDIAARGIVDRSHIFIRFEQGGRVTGSTGLNNFTGSATIAEQAITFGPMASTRRAGPEALMDQEQRFLAALGATATWRIDENNLLHLHDAAGKPQLRLSPMPADQAAKQPAAAP